MNRIPIAIVVAGIIIAVGLFLRFRPAPVPNAPLPEPTNTGLIRPVSTDDHVLGDPRAPIVIVEYGDLECPFCKEFHGTMQRIMSRYRNGEVAWVYRHFPDKDLHPKAVFEARASECVAELGGNTAFWDFIDSIFAITPSNNRLDLSLLPGLAEDAGVDRLLFQECLDSGRHADRVDKDFEDARRTGGVGTPHSFIIAGGTQQFPIESAQSYDVMRELIETILSHVAPAFPSEI